MTTQDPQSGLEALVTAKGHRGALAYLAAINDTLKAAGVHKLDRHRTLLVILDGWA